MTLKCSPTLCLIATSQHFLKPLFAGSPQKTRDQDTCHVGYCSLAHNSGHALAFCFPVHLRVVMYYCLPFFGVPFIMQSVYWPMTTLWPGGLESASQQYSLLNHFHRGVGVWLDGRHVQKLMDTGCAHTMILTSSVTPSAVDRTRCSGVVCVWRHNVLYYSYSRATSRLVAREESGDAAPRGLESILRTRRDHEDWTSQGM